MKWLDISVSEKWLALHQLPKYQTFGIRITKALSVSVSQLQKVNYCKFVNEDQLTFKISFMQPRYAIYASCYSFETTRVIIVHLLLFIYVTASGALYGN